MTATNSALLDLGCAALLIAVVMLGLSPKIRAGLFAVLILTASICEQSGEIEHVRVPAVIIAAAD
jgi:hypothetical protein